MIGSSPAILSRPEDADTSLLIPSEGDGLLRQGSKRLWKRLATREASLTSVGGVHTEEILIAQRQDDNGPVVYNLLSNINNNQAGYNNLCYDQVTLGRLNWIWLG